MYAQPIAEGPPNACPHFNRRCPLLEPPNWFAVCTGTTLSRPTPSVHNLLSSRDMLLLSVAPPARLPHSALSIPPRGLPLRPSTINILDLHKRQLKKRRNCCRKGHSQGSGRGCRAELTQDAPFAVAIGACILNSVIFPICPDREDDHDGAMDSTDMRLAVMGIISFIPYFDWMSWVFAWLDSGRRRYLVYSIVYLAPYLRTNLSLSTEESWLPIASIVLCIIHVQLEISVMNGDLSGIKLLDELRKFFSKSSTKYGHSQDSKRMHSEGRNQDHAKLPSSQQEKRNNLRQWKVPGKPVDRLHQLYESEDADEERRK